MIYRGYNIKPREESGYGIYKSGSLVISQPTEEACLDWIDARKKAIKEEKSE